MLEELLQHLNNWFPLSDGIHNGAYTIEDGSIALPFLQDGQYFRIIGSVFNDGLHRYGPGMVDLDDETFTGTIWALAIPKAVIAIADEAAQRIKEQEKAIYGPYTTESFGGYSYSKGSSGDGVDAFLRANFGARLSPYRRLRGI